MEASKKLKPQKKQEEKQEAEIPAIKLETARFTIQSTSPFICHKFSTKAEKQMAEKQAGAPRHKKPPKDPIDDFKQCFYVLDGSPNDDIVTETVGGKVIARGTFGFPASAIKKAAVSACRYAEGIPMTRAWGSFHVLGDLLEIESDEPPHMRTDVVRLNSGMKPVADLRYRPEFTSWSMSFLVHYNKAVISIPEIANLLNIAGFAVGLGEWRPEKKGSHGMFQVGSK